MIFEAGTGSFGRRSISERFLNSFQLVLQGDAASHRIGHASDRAENRPGIIAAALEPVPVSSETGEIEGAPALRAGFPGVRVKFRSTTNASSRHAGFPAERIEERARRRCDRSGVPAWR